LFGVSFGGLKLLFMDGWISMLELPDESIPYTEFIEL